MGKSGSACDFGEKVVGVCATLDHYHFPLSLQDIHPLHAGTYIDTVQLEDPVIIIASTSYKEILTASSTFDLTCLSLLHTVVLQISLGQLLPQSARNAWELVILFGFFA